MNNANTTGGKRMSNPGNPVEPREALGRFVRQVWLQWASEQPEPKLTWLLSWEEIDAGQREVDMRIGTALFEAGQRSMWNAGDQSEYPGQLGYEARIAMESS
jgi:hypothetical protein